MKQLVAIIVITCLLFGLVACNASHIHTFSSEWSYNDAFHFHKATCGDTDEVKDKEPHVMNEDGKCEICDYEQKTEEPGTENPKQIDSSVLSEQTQPATSEQKERAIGLITALAARCTSGGFADGDLYCKDHTAEGASAQNSEYKIDGFNGGFGDLGGVKVSFTRLVPTYGSTKKEFYYADDDCAVEDFGANQKCYEVSGTASSLLENLFSELETQINYALTLSTIEDCKIGYLNGDFELVRLEYSRGSNEKALYVFAFSDGEAAGLKVNRSYFTATAYAKQVELLIGDYGVEKPDTTGFTTVAYSPKWAAGYPSVEVFDREFTETDHNKVRSLLVGTANNLGRKDNTVILASGDIQFTYQSTTRNEIVFDKDGLSMRVYEKSLIFESDAVKSAISPVYTDSTKLKPVPPLPDKDSEELVTIEHYADSGICYETVGGETKAFIGDYSSMFYSMMPRTLVNLCDFIIQYLNAPNSYLSDGVKAFEVYINESEYTSIKIVVPECGQMIYVYDEEGKLLAIKVEINGGVGTLLVGKFNVKIPSFDDYTASAGVPNTGYLGSDAPNVGNTGSPDAGILE